MKQLKVFLLTFILLTACTPQASSTDSPPALSETALPTQSESILNPDNAWLWKEVRNERFGFGIAVPCWWEVIPMPTDGIISTMTIRNFDEAFFTKYSEKGTWISGNPPQGVMSMDITAATNIDPNLSMVDAYLQLVDTSIYSVLSTQEKTIGKIIYTVVVLKNQVNPSEPASVVYLKGLTPDSILIFSTLPTEAIFSADAHSIFGSFVGVSDETIILPNVIPSPALINVACPF